MSNLAIKVENLSKKYMISHERERGDDNFREAIIGTTKKIITSLNPFSQTSARKDTTKEEFLALDNISFEVNQGDKVGIIGRNGAGKSTLLKVLSRITEPTSGKIHINGRIASLLEVGTGFHPELTGRENIYLNGAILGMSRAEIKKKFDEIVAFAEVEKFLDTPVKRYSSGMYVRLAFAVAAHLEPEILVVDEVLAVGDVEFQKKCLGKMSEVSKEGRTILFVSHNIAAIQKLCNKAILLEMGKLTHFDKTETVSEMYLQSYVKSYENLSIKKSLTNIPSNDFFQINHIVLVQEEKEVNTIIENGKDLSIQLFYEVKKAILDLRLFIDILDINGTLIVRSFCFDRENTVLREKGSYISKLQIPKNFLAPKQYLLAIRAGIYKKQYILGPDALQIPISVIHTGCYNHAYPEEKFRVNLLSSSTGAPH